MLQACLDTLIFPLPEISTPIQWLNNKVPAPPGSELQITFDTNVHFPSAAVTAYHSYLMVGRHTALTYSVTCVTKAPQGQWLDVIRHVANTSAMIDGDDILQGPWLLLLSDFFLSVPPGLELSGTVPPHLTVPWLQWLKNWPAFTEQWDTRQHRTSVLLTQKVCWHVGPRVRTQTEL